MTKARVIVWIVLFVGIVLNMLHIDVLSVAILSMVVKHADDSSAIINQRSAKINNPNDRTMCGYYNEKTMIVANQSAEISQTVADEKSISKNNYYNRFDWSKSDQNLVLGSVGWFIWTGNFIAGLLMHRFGAKIVIGLSTVMCAFASFLTPPSAFIGPMVVAIISGMKGFLITVAFPVGAIMIIGKWSPLEERGKFMSVFIAVPLGGSIGFMLHPYIIERIGWPYAFHTDGILSLVWCLSWWYYVYDTPEQHPRIEHNEKNYIKLSLAGEVASEQLPIPWKQILTSVPFYIIASNHFAFIWLDTVIISYGPTYFANSFEFSTKQSGTIISVSFFLRAVLIYFGGVVTDGIIKRKLLSITNVRKLWTVLGTVIPGLSLLLLVFHSCNASLAVVGVITNIAFGSFFTVGMSTSVIDLSPNFCNILQSICCTVAFSASFVVALLVQCVSKIHDTYTQWQIVFAVSMIVQIVPAIVFLLFGESEIQPWNNPPSFSGDTTATVIKNPIRNRKSRYCKSYKSIPIDADNNSNNNINDHNSEV